MQSRAFLHACVTDKPPLGKEVRRQLDRATEAGSNHRSTNTTVQTRHTLGAVDLRQTVPGIAVDMLCANRKRRRVTLQTRLDKEEWASGGRANDT